MPRIGIKASSDHTQHTMTTEMNLSPRQLRCARMRPNPSLKRSANVSLPAIICTMLCSPAFTFSSVYPLVFCRVPGFAFGCCASFKPFWPLALLQQALPAIIFQAVRRFRGTVLFRNARPSSTWSFPFWLVWLPGSTADSPSASRLLLVVSPLLGAFIES